MAFQVTASLLDACVLANVSGEDAYGYVLTQNLKDVINVSESSLYPVLRRLQGGDLLTAYDKPFQGRNRRYYRITDAGRSKLSEYVEEWQDFNRKVSRILMKGGSDDEQSAISQGA
jgi:PadR family transcriptional regulator PadR